MTPPPPPRGGTVGLGRMQRLVVVLGLVVTIGAALLIVLAYRAVKYDEAAELFERDVDMVRSAVVARLEEHLTLLRGAAGFWSNVPAARRADWESYVTGLHLDERYPGIEGLTFIALVPVDHEDAFVAEVRRHLYLQFAIRPEAPPPGATDRFVITHIEPFISTSVAIGYDAGSDPVRRAAAEAARDSGTAEMTMPVNLIIPNEGRHAYVAFMPVYRPRFPLATVEQRREALLGWVGMGIQAAPLLHGAVGGRERRTMNVAVRHVENGRNILLYDDDLDSGQPGVGDHLPLLRSQREIVVFGRRWVLDARSTQAFEAALFGGESLVAAIALACAVAVTGGLALLLLSRRQKTLLAEQAMDMLRLTERRLESILDASPAVIYRLGPPPTFHPEFFSTSIAQFGLALDDVTAGTIDWAERIHPDDAGTYRAALAALPGSDTIEVTYRLRDGAGHWRWVLDRMAAVHDGDGTITEVVGAAIDVTDRTELEHELREKTAALQRSNSDLQQFAYVASHDLQEPLRTIASYLQLIERRYAPTLDEPGREFIGYAVDGARRMSRLIQDLLAFSRVDSRGREAAPVSLADALRDAVSGLALRAEEAHAVLSLPPPETLPWVLGDDVQIASVFQNLIGNGLKYSRSDEPPRIEVSVSVDPAGRVATVAVRDHGIGIDPQFHDRIFQVFQRLHPAGTYEGTGIGLAICKRIVQRHHGRIWVDSTPGGGSTFYFSLPLAKAPLVTAG